MGCQTRPWPSSARAGLPLSLCYNDDVPAFVGVPASILIVDDDEGVSHAFARMLRMEGFRVRTAMNAEMGLLEAKTSRPDAIILDLRMPLIDGLGFLRRLRATARQRHTPVAIVTGDLFLDGDVTAELTRLGAQVRYKPLWLDDLVGLARSLVKVSH